MVQFWQSGLILAPKSALAIEGGKYGQHPWARLKNPLVSVGAGIHGRRRRRLRLACLRRLGPPSGECSPTPSAGRLSPSRRPEPGWQHRHICHHRRLCALREQWWLPCHADSNAVRYPDRHSNHYSNTNYHTKSHSDWYTNAESHSDRHANPDRYTDTIAVVAARAQAHSYSPHLPWRTSGATSVRPTSNSVEPQCLTNPLRCPVSDRGNAERASVVAHNHFCPRASEPHLVRDEANFRNVRPRDTHALLLRIALLIVGERLISQHDATVPCLEHTWSHTHELP